MNTTKFIFPNIKVLVFQVLTPLLFFVSCQNEPTKKEVPTKVEQTPIVEALITPPEIKTLPLPKKDFISITIPTDSMSFKGIELFISQKGMEEQMGAPDSIVRPMYECGFYSEEEQGRIFYQYFYDKLNFIVYDGRAELEFVTFEKGDQIIISNVMIEGGMSFEEIGKRLNFEVTENTSKTIITIETYGLDEHYYLHFIDEKLIKFERWTPC